MKNRALNLFAFITIFILFLNSCSTSPAAPSAIPPASAIIASPTSTITPSSTATILPTATSTPTPTIAVMDLSIVTDLADPEKFQFIEWDYINSPAWIETLIGMDKKGLLREVPETAKPVDYMVYTYNPSSAMIRNNGFDSLFFPDQPEPYTIISQRPWILIGIWKTLFDEKEVFVYVDKWKNKDGTNGFLGYIVDNGPNMINLEQLQEDSNDTRYMLVGRYFVESEVRKEYDCEDYSKRLGLTTFCKWYFSHPEIVLAPEIFKRWEETGILTNTVTDASGETVYLLPLMPPLGTPMR